PLRFEESDDGSAKITELTHADVIVMRPEYWVHTDTDTGERIIDGGYLLMASSTQALENGASLGSDNDSFATICSLELRLDPEMAVAECDDNKRTANDESETIAFCANVRFKLLDVLATVYELFGEPVFDYRNPKQVNEDERAFEEFKKRREEEKR